MADPETPNGAVFDDVRVALPETDGVYRVLLHFPDKPLSLTQSEAYFTASGSPAWADNPADRNRKWISMMGAIVCYWRPLE